MEFIKLLKAGSIISGINWAIYLIHEWVNFAKTNPPEILAEGDPIFLGLIAQSIASLGLIGFGVFYRSSSPTSTDTSKVRNKPHLKAPPTSFSKPNENAIFERTEPQVRPVENSFTPVPFANSLSQSPTPSQPVVQEKAAELSVTSNRPSSIRVPTVKISDTNHRLIALILIVMGLVGAAIYFVKLKPVEVPKQAMKSSGNEENTAIPLVVSNKPALLVTEPINQRWLGKWVSGNTQITITEENLIITNLETKTDLSFRWLGSEPSENPLEPIVFYGKNISKANLVSNFEKYTSSVSNPSDDQKNQFEQTRKSLEDLSDGSYRIIRLKMSWSAGVYQSYIFDKNSIFKLDFESEESLNGITRYKKMN
jgi:hypothetical protein